MSLYKELWAYPRWFAMADPPKMKAFGCFLLFSLSLSSFSSPYSAAFPEDKLVPGFEHDMEVSGLTFENPRLERAYKALQALKKAIVSDPLNMTENWVGADVCSYDGISCSPSLDDPSVTVVYGIDLNKGDIAGHLPPELELLTELAFLHLNSNRFCGIVPMGVNKFEFLNEFDISNNRFVGPFPKVVLEMPSLKYLDLRFNDFEGPLPTELFEKELDAIFVNNNRFTSTIPETLGKSTVSVAVFANNNFSGCIPKSIGKMPMLEQIIFTNNNLYGCLPEELGLLEKAVLIDLSNNKFTGILPRGLAGLKSLEVLNLQNNKLTGIVPDSVCDLPMLAEFKVEVNYFKQVGRYCYSPSKHINLSDKGNCLEGMPEQKDKATCLPVVNRPVDCSKQCIPNGYGANPIYPSRLALAPVNPIDPKLQSPPSYGHISLAPQSSLTPTQTPKPQPTIKPPSPEPSQQSPPTKPESPESSPNPPTNFVPSFNSKPPMSTPSISLPPTSFSMPYLVPSPAPTPIPNHPTTFVPTPTPLTHNQPSPPISPISISTQSTPSPMPIESSPTLDFAPAPSHEPVKSSTPPKVTSPSPQPSIRSSIIPDHSFAPSPTNFEDFALPPRLGAVHSSPPTPVFISY